MGVRDDDHRSVDMKILSLMTVTDDEATQGAVCALLGRLANGQVVMATVTFGQPTSGCCVTFVPSGGEFTLSDAGTSG
jgi:hypothetical protein